MKPTRLPGPEALESRIAPASIVNATTVTYTDVDGDAVTVQITKGALTAADLVFNTGFGEAGPQQLLLINFGGDTEKARTDLTITVSPAGGDGLAHVGYIDATGIDLRDVTVPGDLGRISAGDAVTTTSGINELTVSWIGVQAPTVTQEPGGDLLSKVAGSLNALAVTGDLNAGTLVVEGSIGSLEIGGDLIGGPEAKSGSIRARGAISQAHIRGDILGGEGNNSGRIVAQLNIDSLILDGSLKGGNLAGSVGAGQILANDRIGVVTIRGNVEGGAGDKSAQIAAMNGMSEVTVNGWMTGGSGVESGVVGSRGIITALALKGGLVGGAGANSGSVLADARIDSVVIGDSATSADLAGGSGDRSGIIASTKGLRSVVVHGSVTGGTGDTTGAIGSTKALGSVQIDGDLMGGSGSHSGQVVSSTSIGDVVVGGSLLGGEGIESAAIGSIGSIESVRLGGDLLGDIGVNSAWIVSGKKIGSIEIAGSAGTSGLVSAGIIESKGAISSIAIGGNIGSLEGEGNPASIYAGRLGSLDVAGSIVSGFEFQATIHVQKSIGSINVGEDILGASRTFGSLSIRAGTEIESISIGGSIAFTEIAIGPGFPGEVQDTPANPDARLGTMTVGGNWFSTSVAVGTFAGADGTFGTSDDKIAHGGDAAVFGTIEEIIIGGRASVGTEAFQSAGIVAEQIKKLSIAGSPITLEAGALNDLVNLAPQGGSFYVREIPVPVAT